MNIWVSCASLFLIPIATIAGAMIIYLLAHGKSSRELKPIATLLLTISVIVASSLTVNVVEIFFELNSTYLSYLGAGLSTVAWVINLAVVGLLFYAVHSDN